MKGLLSIALLLTVCMAHCAALDQGGAQAAPPSFIGFVTVKTPGGPDGIVGRVTVESHADKLVTRYVLIVTRDTVIARRDDGSERPASFDVIAIKDWVHVWFAGQPTDASPRQVTARKIVIVPRP